MQREEFAERIVAMQDTLYRISYGILARPEDRADAVQEALRKAWQQRAKLRNDAFIHTWVVRILINECHNLHRSKQHEVPVETLPERIAPPDGDPALHDALLKLDEAMRIPVLLHYMEGYAIKEIAGILRLPSGTVKTRLMRGRNKLRQLLEQDEREQEEQEVRSHGWA